MTTKYRKGEPFKSFMELMQYIDDGGRAYFFEQDFQVRFILDSKVTQYIFQYMNYAPAIKIEEPKSFIGFGIS